MKRGLPVLALALLLTACGSQPGAKAALPAECEAYLATVSACVEKVGGTNPGVATFKQQMESSRAEWAKVEDKSRLAPACKQMQDAFKQTAAALKC